MDFLQDVPWLGVSALIFSLLIKPRGIRLFLLILGAISLLFALIYIEEDVSTYFFNGSDILWILAAVVTIFHLKTNKNNADINSSGTIKEALTVIPITDDNPEDLLNRAREALYSMIENALEKNEPQKGINIQLLQSQNYSEITFVSLSIFRPETTEERLSKKMGVQSVLLIKLNSHPFMDYQITYNIQIESSNRIKKYNDVYELSELDLADLMLDLLTNDKWAYKPKQLKQAPIQFWRKTNQVNEYKQFRKIDILMMLFPPFFIFPLLRRMIFGASKHLKLTTGKPGSEPRELLQLDSWQVSIKGLKSYENQMTSEFIDSMGGNENQLGELTRENIWYWGVDGKVERQQHVFRLGRAIVFIKIYSYGEDLYIGWDAHVNAGSWDEKKIGQGYSTQDSKKLDIFSIEKVWHQPNEFDISDANFALETVHATIVKLTRRLIKERDIDQEIDFTIVRESRTSILNKKEKPTDNNKKKRFMRTG